MKRKPTEIGKILRKLRVESGETAGVMAEKLGVTASYLSAIELGKRRLGKIKYGIFLWYHLSKQEWETIDMFSTHSIKLDCLRATEEQIKTARLFAWHFRKLDPETLRQISFFIMSDITRKQKPSEIKFARKQE